MKFGVSSCKLEFQEDLPLPVGESEAGTGWRLEIIWKWQQAGWERKGNLGGGEGTVRTNPVPESTLKIKYG